LRRPAHPRPRKQQWAEEDDDRRQAPIDILLWRNSRLGHLSQVVNAHSRVVHDLEEPPTIPHLGRLVRCAGDPESFRINFEIHFLKIVVLFREGKAIAIFGFEAGDHGRYDAPNGVIDYLKRQDAAAGAAGHRRK
jgi:hypothetical protein